MALLGLAASVILGAGCQGNGTSKLGQTCQSKADCEGTLACSSGRVCFDPQPAVPPDASLSSQAGDDAGPPSLCKAGSCTQHTDCAAGDQFCNPSTRCCEAATCLNGGAPCVSPDVCGADGRCVAPARSGCSADTECCPDAAAARSCAANVIEFCDRATGKCLEGCRGDSDCGAGKTCDLGHKCRSMADKYCDDSHACRNGEQCKYDQCVTLTGPTCLVKDTPCDPSNPLQDQCCSCLHCCPVFHVCVSNWWNSQCW